MNKKILFLSFLICFGCSRNGNDSVWDEQTTTTHYLEKAKNFFKRPKNDSKLVNSEDEFFGREEEFIPLRDEDLRAQSGNFAYTQADPPTVSGKVPGLAGFKKPTGDMGALFKTVYFNTDNHTLSRDEYFGTLRNIARQVKSQPNLYVFVEGHCDERASESYNLALGTRRANYVRTQLIKAGVPQNRVFTVSFGKEKPAVPGHDRVAWAKNRRCEFKIYEKPTLVQN
ncbi:MAG: OmpA family protein [Candidatus Algichlamydia australiensis]|nr:OmpA family protein [Chlamydiales bacterium]